MRRIVATIADLHSGHALGLCNPKTIFRDEGPDGEIVEYHPALKEIQKYLWAKYMADNQRIEVLADNDEITLFVDGDLTHGQAHPEHLMRSRLSDQTDIGIMNLVPWLEMPNLARVRIQIGTDAHNSGEGSTERIIATALQAMYPKVDIKVHYHTLMTIDEVKFDVAHHGPGQSKRYWLEGNTARYYLRDLMLKDIVRCGSPPNVVQRAHYHTYIREWLEVEDWESWLVVVPSYCALGSYGHKVTRSTGYQQHGCVAYELIDGRLRHVYKYVNRLDLRTKERIGDE